MVDSTDRWAEGQCQLVRFVFLFSFVFSCIWPNCDILGLNTTAQISKSLQQKGEKLWENSYFFCFFVCFMDEKVRKVVFQFSIIGWTELNLNHILFLIRSVFWPCMLNNSNPCIYHPVLVYILKSLLIVSQCGTQRGICHK